MKKTNGKYPSYPDDIKMAEIRAVEDKYGLAIFRMGLTQMIDFGVRNLSSDESINEAIEKIIAQGRADKEMKRVPIMSTEFQCAILRCAADIAQFNIWDVIKYIKRHVHVD